MTASGDLPPESAAFQLSFARERGLAFSSGPERELGASGEGAGAAGRYVLIDNGQRIVSELSGADAADEHVSLGSAFRYSFGSAESAKLLLSLLLADLDGGRRGWPLLHDVSLVLPSSRAGCHELRAGSEDGKALTIFIGKVDHLLHEWREHSEYPAQRKEDDAAYEAWQELIAKGGWDWLRPFGRQEFPSYAVDRVMTFHPRLDPELSEASFDLAGMRTATQVETPETSLTVEGIGVVLAPSAAGWTVGTLREGPARRAGLRHGDLIVQVDGVDITRHSRASASQLIRGPAGSRVQLALLRGNEWLELSVQREAVLISVDW